MTDRELKRLSRADLLEMMIALSKENEQLRTELSETRQQLADRIISIEEAGSIAEASLRLNGVFEAAQNACEQYIKNISLKSERCDQMEKETAEKCARMLEEARSQADQIKADRIDASPEERTQSEAL